MRVLGGQHGFLTRLMEHRVICDVLNDLCEPKASYNVSERQERERERERVKRESTCIIIECDPSLNLT